MPGNDRTWRQLTVWLHVVSSVGWMATALTLLALLALTFTEPDKAPSATAMAHFLDDVLLAPMANTSASTGLVLSLGTAWGLIHQRWVLTKFAITLGQLYAGIVLLSKALNEAARTTEAGPAMIAGTLAMAGALGFQAWLSVAKPWPRTRWARHRESGRPIRLPTAPPALFALAVLAPLVDIAVGTFAGFPTPVLSLLSVVAAAVIRRRALRTPAVAGRPSTRDTAAAIGETRP